MRRLTKALVCTAMLVVCSGRLAHAAPIVTLDFTNSLPTFGTDFSNLSNDNGLVIRWGSIASIGGFDVDLVATVTGGSYAANNINPPKVNLNGLSGSPSANFRFGRINLRNDHSANFTLTLVDPGDNDSEVLANFNFSILDLDTGPASAVHPTPASEMESVQLLDHNGTATWTTTGDTELSSTYQPTTPAATWAAPVITATQPFFGATTAGTGADNPTDPFDLTPLQANRSVSFSFQDTSSFTIRLGIGPSGEEPFTEFPFPNDGGRNFLLTGDTAPLPEPSTFSLTLLGLLSLGMMDRRRRRR